VTAIPGAGGSAQEPAGGTLSGAASTDAAPSARREELAGALEALERRLTDACAAAARPRADVTLIAVTKTFPASDVALLAGLGVHDVAENKDQEAKAKHADLADAGLRWHFVGQLQRNKARSVVRYADVVHSVDRAELAEALGGAAQRLRERPLKVLLQVDLGEQPEGGLGPSGAPRGGVRPELLAELAAAVAAQAALELAGVMAVAPLGGEPDGAFARLATLSTGLVAEYPNAGWISAGMSGDFEAAIRHGATHVRVGSALLGKRVTGHGSVRP
jgi:pyridoxal phosphate enzyme (YggS family)